MAAQQKMGICVNGVWEEGYEMGNDYSEDSCNRMEVGRISLGTGIR